jgi:hypothetical protein
MRWGALFSRSVRDSLGVIRSYWLLWLPVSIGSATVLLPPVPHSSLTGAFYITSANTEDSGRKNRPRSFLSMPDLVRRHNVTLCLEDGFCEITRARRRFARLFASYKQTRLVRESILCFCFRLARCSASRGVRSPPFPLFSRVVFSPVFSGADPGATTLLSPNRNIKIRVHATRTPNPSYSDCSTETEMRSSRTPRTRCYWNQRIFKCASSFNDRLEPFVA